MTMVRAEAPSDHDPIRLVHTLAFAGPTEAALVDRLRGSPGSISLVATDSSEVVGHILFTTVTLTGGGRPVRMAGLGPMAVTPARQQEGIGSRLVARGVEECRRRGYEAIAVVGHPSYYTRFGFRRGDSLGLRCQFDVPAEAFMAMELSHGVLAGGGEVRFAPAFSMV